MHAGVCTRRKSFCLISFFLAHHDLKRLETDCAGAKQALHAAKLAVSANAGRHRLEAERVKLDLEGQAAHVSSGCATRAAYIIISTECTVFCMRARVTKFTRVVFSFVRFSYYKVRAAAKQ
jgi:hypothetical protein